MIDFDNPSEEEKRAVDYRFTRQPDDPRADHGAPKLLDPERAKAEFAKIISLGQSEAERAAELKGRAGKLMIELCALMDEGLREGLLIRWNGIIVSQLIGRHEVVDLHIEKRF